MNDSSTSGVVSIKRLFMRLGWQYSRCNSTLGPMKEGLSLSHLRHHLIAQRAENVSIDYHTVSHLAENGRTEGSKSIGFERPPSVSGEQNVSRLSGSYVQATLQIIPKRLFLITPNIQILHTSLEQSLRIDQPSLQILNFNLSAKTAHECFRVIGTSQPTNSQPCIDNPVPGQGI